MSPVKTTKSRYITIARQIQKRIQKGELKPGDRLPTQREMAESYDTTLMTIRQALEVLMEENLVRVEHGVGTFVAVPQSLERNFQLMGFSHEMRRRDIQIETEVLNKQYDARHPNAARLFKLPDDADLVLLERRRLYGGRPIVYQKSYVAPWYRKIVESYTPEFSLYEQFMEQSNQSVGMTREILEPVILTQETARVLARSAGDLAILAIRSSFSVNNPPLVYDEAILASDRVAVTSERIGPRVTMAFQLLTDDSPDSFSYLLEED